MSVLDAAFGLGGKVDAATSGAKRAAQRFSRGFGQVRSGARGSDTWRRGLTEFVVIAILLAIPSKLIWDMRDSSLAYIANTKAERAATQAQIAQGKALLQKADIYKALQAQYALKVPKTVGYSQILSTLTTLAGRSGVELDTVSAASKKPSPIAGAVYEWTVNATITGPLSQIQSYIDELQSEPRLYQVTQAQVAVAGVGASAASPHVNTSTQTSFNGSIDNAVLTIGVESLS